MKEFDFQVYFEGPELTDSLLDQFYEAGCDDALIGQSDGQKSASFTRDGESFADAVVSALGSLSGVAGVVVTHIKSDDHPEQAERFNRALTVTH